MMLVPGQIQNLLIVFHVRGCRLRQGALVVLNAMALRASDSEALEREACTPPLDCNN